MWKLFLEVMLPRAIFGIDDIALAVGGSALLGGILGHHGQEEANTQNRQIGLEQMQFQERMSSTAYQRAVQDMEAAGLNPMLAYSQGGASTVPGSAPRMENTWASGAQTGAAVASAGETAIRSKRTAAETMSNHLLEKKLEMEIQVLVGQNFIQNQQSNILYQRYEQSFSERDKAKWDAITSSAEAQIALDVAKGKKLEGQIDETTYGEILRFIDRAMRALRGGSSAAGQLRR